MNNLPISAAALGSIDIFGQPVDQAGKITWVDESSLLVNNNAFYKRVANNWGRFPGHQVIFNGDSTLNCYQVNSLSSDSSLHTLVHPQSAKHERALFEIVTTNLSNAVSGTFELNPLITFEEMILRRELASAERMLTELDAAGAHPRYWFAKASLALLQSDFRGTKEALNKAITLGHPEAFDAAIQVSNLAARPFRKAYPEIFHLIAQNRYTDVIPLLQSVSEEFSLEAGTVLAYVLRHAHLPHLGEQICHELLEKEPYLVDVYGHLWSFQTAQHKDEEALNTALARLSYYPNDPQAYADALDSALLLSDINCATWMTHGYLINAVNLQTALKHIFKLAEHTSTWSTASQQFAEIFSTLRAPTPETLTLYAEILTELGDFDPSQRHLERAMMAAPEDVGVVLSYGRNLAQSGKEQEAIQFMATVLNDQSRNDHPIDRVLLLTLLSELLRNTGNLPEAHRLWDTHVKLNRSLLREVGPRPFIEYIYCLIECGECERALTYYKWIDESSEFDFMLRELRETLQEMQLV